MTIKNLKEKSFIEKNDMIPIVKGSKNKLISGADDTLLKKYEKKLKSYTDKTGRKASKKLGDEKESAYRLRLLREGLGLTLQKMANICHLPLGKFTRLEGGGTTHGTPINKEDATRICVAVLKNFGILIKPEWLLCLTSEVPAALLSTEEVKKRVEEYTKECIIDRGIADTLSIFLEMHHLERIQGVDRTTFVMVSDNRLGSRYQKGDYVGGLIVKPELYYLLNGYDCIISMRKEPDVKFVRTVYFKIPNHDEVGVTNDTIVLLCTETKEPVIAKVTDINNIWIIFYHRKNNEEFTNLLNLLSSTDSIGLKSKEINENNNNIEA